MTGPPAVQSHVPGYWLRVAVAAAVVGIVVVLASAPTLLVVAVLVVGAACVLWPGSPAALVLIVLVALGATTGPFGTQVLLLVPLVHLLHISCAHAALVPMAAHVHPAALRPALIRAAGVQVATFVLVGIGAMVPAAPGDVLVVGLAAASCTALALLFVRLTRRT